MKLLLCFLALSLGGCAGYDSTFGLEYRNPDGSSYGGTVKLQHTPK